MGVVSACEGFNAGAGVGLAVGVTLLMLALTYVLHLWYVRSFNHIDSTDQSSLTHTELNRRDNSIIDTSHLPIDSQPHIPSKTRLEILFVALITVVMIVGFWSVSGQGTVNIAVVYQWLVGLVVDSGVRLGVCAVLVALKAAPNYSKNCYIVDFGVPLNQIIDGNKREICSKPEASDISPPPCSPVHFPGVSPPTPRKSPIPHSSPYKSPSKPTEILHLPPLNPRLPIVTNYAQDFDDYFDQLEAQQLPQPDFSDPENSENRGKEQSNRSESEHFSMETMSEVAHNLMSPVESPRGFSGMRFFRTPEKPCIKSPEKSPEKPYFKAKSPQKFELRLQEMDKSVSESEPEGQSLTYSAQAELPIPSTPSIPTPEIVDDESYRVEFAPNALMPNRDFFTEIEERSSEKNGRKRRPSPMVSKMRLVLPEAGKPSSRVFTEEDAPVTDDALREIGNSAEYSFRQRRPSRKEVEGTVGELLQAAQEENEPREYGRLVDMLEARNRFHRRHYVTSGRSPYNASMKGLIERRGSKSSRLRLIEDPDAAERQAKQIEALSSIYAQSRSGSSRRARSGSRGRSEER